MSEAEISDVFADIAAERGSEAGRDRAGMSLRTLAASEQREQAVALLGRLLSQPSFPQDFLERDRARTIASIKEAMTKPGPIANRALWEAMYQTHPYARQPSVESIAAITRADLVAFHARHYVANRAVIALIGAVSREQAHVIAQQLTVRLAQGAALAALPDTPAPAPSEQRISNPASQAHILLGAPFVARGDPDYFALTVGNYVLGGGSFVSRLTREVREKRGLVYSVYSFFNPLAQDGPFLVGLQTRKEQADEALALVRQTVSEWLRDGPTEQELQAAKDNLVGGFALRIDSNRKILNNMAVIGFYQLPLDYLDTWSAKVAAVSRDAVRQAFARKLRDERMHTVVVGP